VTATKTFRQVDAHMGGSTHDVGDVEIVLSHIEALKDLGGCTLVLLQGGNGIYVRESVAEVRAALDPPAPKLAVACGDCANFPCSLSPASCKLAPGCFAPKLNGAPSPESHHAAESAPPCDLPGAGGESGGQAGRVAPTPSCATCAREACTGCEGWVGKVAPLRDLAARSVDRALREACRISGDLRPLAERTARAKELEALMDAPQGPRCCTGERHEAHIILPHVCRECGAPSRWACAVCKAQLCGGGACEAKHGATHDYDGKPCVAFDPVKCIHADTGDSECRECELDCEWAAKP
jgi:hypothetical protein